MISRHHYVMWIVLEWENSEADDAFVCILEKACDLLKSSPILF